MMCCRSIKVHERFSVRIGDFLYPIERHHVSDTQTDTVDICQSVRVKHAPQANHRRTISMQGASAKGTAIGFSTRNLICESLWPGKRTLFMSSDTTLVDNDSKVSKDEVDISLCLSAQPLSKC
jgi:hypothetical protein